jgi:hypothetical protein
VAVEGGSPCCWMPRRTGRPPGAPGRSRSVWLKHGGAASLARPSVPRSPARRDLGQRLGRGPPDQRRRPQGTDDDPWLLITDLPASPTRCCESRHRTQEGALHRTQGEALFRDRTSFGWQWQDSRVRLPDRVDRLLLALSSPPAGSTPPAHDVLRHGRRHLIDDRSRRSYSRFHLGLHWLRRSFALLPDTRPPRKLS